MQRIESDFARLQTDGSVRRMSRPKKANENRRNRWCRFLTENNPPRNPHNRTGLKALKNCKDIEALELEVLGILRETCAQKDGHRGAHRECTKEEIAFATGVKTHFVEQVFMRLNHKGILSQETRDFAHDTNRNPMFFGRDSGWAANTYTIHAERLNAIAA